MRKTLLWFLHEVVTNGWLHAWREEPARSSSGGKRWESCRCGAMRVKL